CKGTVSIFDFASDLKNFFFYSGCGALGRYYPLARQKVPRPVRVLKTCVCSLPVGLLPFGTAKVAGLLEQTSI
ncbi:hypothetical protein J4D99_16645, partial [Siccationidurans ginsengisoli]|uniref:hypothetical protein n=1 Tax=Hymenobacter sp. BT559 TaxID=2795729 RepID=UPI001AADF84B